MTNIREEKIDNAVSSAAELIAALQESGPINGGQARTIIEAAVRAQVGNAEEWEILQSTLRVSADLESAKTKAGAA